DPWLRRRITQIDAVADRRRVRAVAAIDEIFAAQSDAAIFRIAVRRPLPRRIGEVQRVVATEAVVGAGRARLEHRHAGKPGVLRADVAARMREQRVRADAAVIRAGGGEILAAENFAAE